MTIPMSEIDAGPLTAISPGEGRHLQAFGLDIAIVRTRAGAVYAVEGKCPHRGGPLADGLIGGTTLICPLHAWKFDLETGQALSGECGIKTYPVRVDDKGHVLLTIDKH